MPCAQRLWMPFGPELLSGPGFDQTDAPQCLHGGGTVMKGLPCGELSEAPLHPQTCTLDFHGGHRT